MKTILRHFRKKNNSESELRVIMWMNQESEEDRIWNLLSQTMEKPQKNSQQVNGRVILSIVSFSSSIMENELEGTSSGGGREHCWKAAVVIQVRHDKTLTKAGTPGVERSRSEWFTGTGRKGGGGSQECLMDFWLRWWCGRSTILAFTVVRFTKCFAIYCDLRYQGKRLFRMHYDSLWGHAEVIIKMQVSSWQLNMEVWNSREVVQEESLTLQVLTVIWAL